jgi:glycerol uptake facilitator-like aquaporin
MPGTTTAQRLLAEGLGTLLLLATVVGSGIMGESLSGGNVAIALMANSIATGAILVVLIIVFGPISGAHFNPAVSGVMFARGELTAPMLGAYIGMQILGGILGVWVAHAMFALPIIEIATKVRTGPPQWLAEAVATFGLIITILGTIRMRPEAVPFTVGLYITAAYWFTASTSFANPAVTVARAFTETFAGIEPSGVVAFILAQFTGATAAFVAARILFNAGKAEEQMVVRSKRALSRARPSD